MDEDDNRCLKCLAASGRCALTCFRAVDALFVGVWTLSVVSNTNRTGVLMISCGIAILYLILRAQNNRNNRNDGLAEPLTHEELTPTDQEPGSQRIIGSGRGVMFRFMGDGVRLVTEHEENKHTQAGSCCSF